MLWKLRQEDTLRKSRMKTMTREEMWKKTVADMQGEIHALQKTVVKLQEQLNEMQKQENDISTDSSYGVGYRQRYKT